MTDRETLRQEAAEVIDASIGSQLGNPDITWLVTNTLQIQDWMLLATMLRKSDAEWIGLVGTAEAVPAAPIGVPGPQKVMLGETEIEAMAIVTEVLNNLGTYERARVYRGVTAFFGLEA